MSEDGARQEKEVTGVDLAYGLVQSSYEWAVVRLNAVENRIQALMVFSASFVLTAPVLISTAGADISLTSWWFYLALAMGLLNLLLGAGARATGHIKLLGLDTVRAEWLEYTEPDFKSEAVYWATEHFEKNVKTVNLKGRAVIVMTGAFLIETVALVVWGVIQVG